MKVALITGAGTGIGKAIALELAKRGTKLALCGPNVPDLNKVGSEAEVEYLAGKVDVRSSKDVEKFVKSTIKQFGRIDLLFNNAGVRHLGSVEETSDKDWDRVLDTNLKGAFICSREVLPIMLKQGEGTIVNVSSINGIFPLPKGSAYCASKAGLNSLTKSMSHEFSRKGVKVISACPYAVNTKVHAKLYPGQESLLMSPEYVGKKIAKLANSKFVRSGSIITIKKRFWSK